MGNVEYKLCSNVFTINDYIINDFVFMYTRNFTLLQYTNLTNITRIIGASQANLLKYFGSSALQFNQNPSQNNQGWNPAFNASALTTPFFNFGSSPSGVRVF